MITELPESIRSIKTVLAIGVNLIERLNLETSWEP